MDKDACVCVRPGYFCVCRSVNVPDCAGMSLCMCVRACIFIFDKDKSTLNKTTSHYAEALMYHRSNVSCITGSLWVIIAFSFHHLPVFISFANQKRNQIRLPPCTSAPKQHSFHVWSGLPVFHLFIFFLFCSYSDSPMNIVFGAAYCVVMSLSLLFYEHQKLLHFSLLFCCDLIAK